MLKVVKEEERLQGVERTITTRSLCVACTGGTVAFDKKNNKIKRPHYAGFFMDKKKATCGVAKKEEK